MILKLKEDIAVKAECIAAVNFFKKTKQKSQNEKGEMVEHEIKARIALIVNSLSIHVEYDDDNMARTMYQVVLKAMEVVAHEKAGTVAQG